MSSPSSLPSGQGFIPQYTTVSRAVKGRNAGVAVILVGFVGGVYAWTYQKMRTVSGALRGRGGLARATRERGAARCACTAVL